MKTSTSVAAPHQSGMSFMSSVEKVWDGFEGALRRITEPPRETPIAMNFLHNHQGMEDGVFSRRIENAVKAGLLASL